jgi:HAD superfamily hydrolase (TIGR01509 family)
MSNPLKNIEIKAVIFDMDGVIVDTEPIHTEAFEQFFKKHDIAYTQDQLNSFIGYSVEENVKQIRDGLSEDKMIPLRESIDERNDLYLNILTQRELLPNPGVDGILGRCIEKGIPLALATSSPDEQVNAILNNLEGKYSGRYSDIFKVITHGKEVMHKKPAPDVYELTVKRLGIIPEKILAIEDSPAGIESANRAGLKTIGYISQFYDRNDLAAAHWLVNNLSDVLDLL